MVFSRKLLTAAVACAMVVSFLACDDSKSPTGPTTSSLIGTWTVNQVHAQGTATIGNMPVSVDTTITAADNESILRFNQDQTYYIKFGPSLVTAGSLASAAIAAIAAQTLTDTGSWSLAGSSLSLHSIPRDTTVTAAVSASGNNLTLVVPADVAISGINGHVTGTISASK
jgi:hypothetical protein